MRGHEYLVTGGAGFIGSHLVDELIRRGHSIRVLDNLSQGNTSNLDTWASNRRFQFLKGDVLSTSDVARSLAEIEVVMHLAASPDVRAGTEDPSVNFRQNVMATHNLLEGIRKAGSVRAMVFTSSSTVYGEPAYFPTPEDYGPLKPISPYGAAKLACEALISAYARTYGFRAAILRLANVVGHRSNHGIILDLVNKLARNSKELDVLGDGTQKKSYIYVEDCVRAITAVFEKATEKVEICNVGTSDWITVKRIAELVKKEMGLDRAQLKFTGGVDGGRGWKGDVKFMKLDIRKLRSFGWKPRHKSQEAVVAAIRAARAESTRKD